ncbi:MAG: COX15/CtaA family protein [Myxococcota bacterium]
MSRFAQYAWGVLGYNILVVLWGAYVRASGSGAGCGEHWPTCNGEVLPRAASIETMIEFTHRLTSGLALLLTIGLVIAAVRLYPTGSRVRKAAWTTLGFMIAEALLGAGLVIFGLVADDDSVARALVICAHLINTLALLGFMALTAWWSDRPGRLNLNQPEARWFSISISGVFLIGVTGAIAALGDTLFPATSLAEGLAADMEPGAHFLLKLRGFHPVLAILVGTGLLYLGKHLRSQKDLSVLATALMGLVGIQIIVGFTNLALLAPIYLQLIHLLLADAVWIVLVVLGASTLEMRRAE